MSNLKPLRAIHDIDILNGEFALNTATGSKGTPVVIDGSGITNGQTPNRVALNMAAGNFLPNVYSPRWEVRGRVRAAVAGEKPIGVTLFDTKEVNQWNYPLLHDKTRREEAQCVLSGQAVPIAQKGRLTVLLPTGTTVNGGQYAIVAGTGEWGVTAVATGTGGNKLNTVFGQYLGPKDADGYAQVVFSCYA